MINYYQILGLSNKSTKEEIKKAYRLYATKFHPDKQNGDKFFEERFKEIQEAYEVLIDDDKREKYNSKFFNDTLIEKQEKQAQKEQETKKKQQESSFEKDEKLIQERKRKEKLLKKTIYYNKSGIYIDGCSVKNGFEEYDFSNYTIAYCVKKVYLKNYNKNIGFAIFMIVVGIFTISFFIGIILLILSITLISRLIIQKHIWRTVLD
jgi:curved DNA-binding protein CbpA